MEPLNGRSAYHLSMDIKAAGMTGSLHPYHDRTDSWLDRDSLTTLRYVKQVRESHYQEDETVELDQACQLFKRHENRIDKKEVTDKQGSMPPYALDTYGALFYLRTLPLAVGDHYDLELFTGDKTLSVSAVVKKKERLKVGAGRFDCFLVEPKLRDAGSVGGKIKQIQWWFSVDEQHVPVKIRMEVAVGHIVAELAKIN
jgi:hypothetical protein